jgi:hypothetical protein
MGTLRKDRIDAGMRSMSVAIQLRVPVIRALQYERAEILFQNGYDSFLNEAVIIRINFDLYR